MNETKIQTEHNIRLTSAEIFNLWSTYMSDSMAKCVLSYFLEKVEDTQIKPILEYALELTKKHIQQSSNLFKNGNIPVPYGFTEKDVNLNAPRLYSDSFFLHYLKHMSRIGLKSNSMALAISTRSDLMKFYSDCLVESIELNNRTTHVLLSKGIYVRPPYITPPSEVEFVQNQSFFGKLFNEPDRPLLASEITNLYGVVQTNALGKALIMGFSQVARSTEVREFMVRGKEIAVKHIALFHDFLTKSDIPTPMTWDGDVLNSTIAPFSDKLMMFHISSLNAIGITDYGEALGTTARRDLSTCYARLTAEIGNYAEDGADLMEKNGWMEKPPQAADRKALTSL